MTRTSISRQRPAACSAGRPTRGRLLAWTALLVALTPAPALAETILIRVVAIVDGTGAPTRAGQAVLIAARRIVWIGPDSLASAPPDATIVDGAGRFLIPGLFDMHVHLSKVRRVALPLLVTWGVTSVRDLGGDIAELFGWRREIASGSLVGPRIRLAGSYLESGVRERFRQTIGDIEPRRRNRIPIFDPASARRAVAALASLDVDLIKVRTWPDLETYRAIGEAAETHGLPLVGHALGLPIDTLIDAGHASVEHSLSLDGAWTEEVQAEAFVKLAANGVVVVPTLIAWHRSLLATDEALDRAFADPEQGRYLSAYLVADWRDQRSERSVEANAFWRQRYPDEVASVRRMHRAGVTLLPGSDLAVLGVFPGLGLHEELALMVGEIGMSPAQALGAATLGAASWLRVDDELGSIAVGKLADLVLLDADPTVRIENARAIRAVILDGRYFDRAALDRLRAEAARADEVRTNDWLPDPPDPITLARRRILVDLRARDEPAALREVTRRAAALIDADEILAAEVERILNRSGYRAMAAEPNKAVAILQLAAGLFPGSANVWDSLGEAYERTRDVIKARDSFQRALEIDPALGSAADGLERLRRGKPD